MGSRGGFRLWVRKADGAYEGGSGPPIGLLKQGWWLALCDTAQNKGPRMTAESLSDSNLNQCLDEGNIETKPPLKATINAT
jgi:hypothetical protein